MCIASGLGMAVPVVGLPDAENLFRERPATYVVEIAEDRFAAASALFESRAVSFKPFGRVLAEPRLVLSEATRVAHDIPVDEMTRAWRGTLDW